MLYYITGTQRHSLNAVKLGLDPRFINTNRKFFQHHDVSIPSCPAPPIIVLENEKKKNLSNPEEYREKQNENQHLNYCFSNSIW